VRLTWKDSGCTDGCVDGVQLTWVQEWVDVWSSSSWARVSGKVEDGVEIFKSCCYLGIWGRALGHMMSRRS